MHWTKRLDSVLLAGRDLPRGFRSRCLHRFDAAAVAVAVAVVAAADDDEDWQRSDSSNCNHWCRCRCIRLGRRLRLLHRQRVSLHHQLSCAVARVVY